MVEEVAELVEERLHIAVREERGPLAPRGRNVGGDESEVG